MRRMFLAEIKGTVLLDTIAAIKARSGESELAKIIADLSNEARAVFEKTIYLS